MPFCCVPLYGNAYLEMYRYAYVVELDELKDLHEPRAFFI